MKNHIAFLAAIALAGPAAAEQTQVDIRALALDAKFIGNSMSGMAVLVEDADTGEILDTGVTSGGTGDTDRIIRQPSARYDTLSREGDAVYTSILDIERPRRIRVTVRGPLAQPQAMAEASATRWVLPGKHINSGDGWMIEVPGFAVDILSPGAHTYVEDNPRSMNVTANVVMVCGCPTSPGGTWDSQMIEITAEVLFEGDKLVTEAMEYTGTESRFSVDIPTAHKGVYEVLVTAFDPRTGNSGIDRTSFILR